MEQLDVVWVLRLAHAQNVLFVFAQEVDSIQREGHVRWGMAFFTLSVQ